MRASANKKLVRDVSCSVNKQSFECLRMKRHINFLRSVLECCVFHNRHTDRIEAYLCLTSSGKNYSSVVENQLFCRG